VNCCKEYRRKGVRKGVIKKEKDEYGNIGKERNMAVGNETEKSR
jgi:hypothetical protein